MSAVTEAVSQRMTLGDLVTDHGFDLVPSYAGDVTITALADDVASVTPGAMYVPCQQVSLADINEACENGAYSALLPLAMKPQLVKHGKSLVDMPLMFADITRAQLARIASTMAGNPSDALAVFALTGPDAALLEHEVSEVARFLHMLGNPVGVINANDSQLLERFLDLSYPVDVLSMQRAIAVCAEDGAAALIVTMNDDTLQEDALQSVAVDVIACDGIPEPDRAQEFMEITAEKYGCAISKQTRFVLRTEESDTLALQSGVEPALVRPLSFAIAIGLAVGVRKNSIRSALRVTREFH
ncbi:UDP-N-acetylmuramyl peptide synthase [Bifidobacterium dolichotidis]|uniref:UDP-N-acetylmuramyl peptide synthase n=1 Tax=Bifidobacterium dolichotidis TaxID=2306976 RepID=A0A430FS37_9BIFI|nr:UDP-N-acetylmuramyl peptide synthase [Bifidobacterium dolichotidis]RSX55696.1 UDP-N-acetylmuramyl peptide synthase [Bifidobacterium dolichotidis]